MEVRLLDVVSLEQQVERRRVERDLLRREELVVVVALKVDPVVLGLEQGSIRTAWGGGEKRRSAWSVASRNDTSELDRDEDSN